MMTAQVTKPNFDKLVAVDIETTSLRPWEGSLLSIQLQHNNGKQEFYGIHPKAKGPIKDGLERIKVLAFAKNDFIAHNAAFEVAWFLAMGVDISDRIYCTSICDKLATGNRHMKYGLLDVVQRRIGEEIILDKAVRRSFPKHVVGEPFTDAQYDYAMADVLYLHDILKAQLQDIEDTKQTQVLQLEMDVFPVLQKMTQRGYYFDVEYLDKVAEKWTAKREAVLQEIIDYVSERIPSAVVDGELQVNLNSPSQLVKFLCDNGIYVKNTKRDTLERIAPRSKFIQLLLKYRDTDKFLGTFCTKVKEHINPETGRMHSQYNSVVSTGRMSCSNPNVQQYPTGGEQGDDFMKVIKAPKGYKIVSLDYAAQELRVAAFLSKDPAWVKPLNQGADFHSLVGSKTFGVPIEEFDLENDKANMTKAAKDARFKAKAFSFGMLYGKTTYGFAKDFNVSKADAQVMINDYFRASATLKAWLDKKGEFAAQNMYTTDTFGRRRDFNRPHQRWMMDGIKRQAANAPIQGLSASQMKKALVEIDKIEGVELLFVIHDSAVVCVPEDRAEELAEKCKETMTKAAEFFTNGEVGMPSDCTISDYWSK